MFSMKFSKSVVQNGKKKFIRLTDPGNFHKVIQNTNIFLLTPNCLAKVVGR